jgi:hypothetical protein
VGFFYEKSIMLGGNITPDAPVEPESQYLREFQNSTDYVAYKLPPNHYGSGKKKYPSSNSHDANPIVRNIQNTKMIKHKRRH